MKTTVIHSDEVDPMTTDFSDKFTTLVGTVCQALMDVDTPSPKEEIYPAVVGLKAILERCKATQETDDFGQEFSLEYIDTYGPDRGMEELRTFVNNSLMILVHLDCRVAILTPPTTEA